MTAVATVLCVFLMLGAVSCDSGTGRLHVTGEIVDVVPQSIDTFSSLTVRDSSGGLWVFGPARVPHFSPSHLIEHQANGDRVTVVYRDEADGSRTVLEIEE